MGVGGIGGRVGWAVAKTTGWSILGAAMMSVGTHTMAHALLVGHTAVGAILGPTTKLAPSVDAIVPVVT